MFAEKADERPEGGQRTGRDTQSGFDVRPDRDVGGFVQEFYVFVVVDVGDADDDGCAGSVELVSIRVRTQVYNREEDGHAA